MRKACTSPCWVVTRRTCHPTCRPQASAAPCTDVSRALSRLTLTDVRASGIATTAIMAATRRPALRRFTVPAATGSAGAGDRWTRYRPMTTRPAARIAVTLVRKSTSAPAACPGWRASKVSPTTVRGGTSEIETATPGRVSEMSLRTRATEPTAPVASAASRLIRFGETREATCALFAASTGEGTSRPTR